MSDRLRLICFEGCDGTGKTTQAAALLRRLEAANRNVRLLKFPNYDSLSSGPVRMYLAGELAEDPGDVNPYAASVLYAADRLCSYKSAWERDYHSGTVFVTDRYVTSNFIFQAAKLPPAERDAFVDWDIDLEHNKMGLPRPDLVIYLDLPVEVSERRVRGRANATGQKIDIHEKDLAYQASVNACGRRLAEKLGWLVINCAPEGELLPVQQISEIIWRHVGNNI